MQHRQVSSSNKHNASWCHYCHQFPTLSSTKVASLSLCSLLTARSTFSERSLKVVCFLHRSWYTCSSSNSSSTKSKSYSKTTPHRSIEASV